MLPLRGDKVHKYLTCSEKQWPLDYIWSTALILPITPAFYCRVFIYNFRYELLFSNYDSNYVFILWVSSLKLCYSVTTLSSSSVHTLPQPFFWPNAHLHILNWGLPVFFNCLFYIFRCVLNLSALRNLYRFKKIIEAITRNTKVHFNTIEKYKSLLPGLKAFSLFFPSENYMA